MDGVVTYVNPYKQTVETCRPSGPFDLIDVTHDAGDPDAEINDAIRGFNESYRKLIDSLHGGQGYVKVSLRSFDNTAGYGELSNISIGLLYASLLGDSTELSFRTKREAMTCIFNLLIAIMDKLPEHQKPEFLDEISDYQSVEADFSFDQDGRIEYRLAALALKLVGNWQWNLVRDSEDAAFDSWGSVGIPACGDKTEELLVGTDGRCMSCGKKVSDGDSYLRLNRYASLCKGCVDKAHDLLMTSGSATVHHTYKSNTEKMREHAEKLGDIFSRR